MNRQMLIFLLSLIVTSTIGHELCVDTTGPKEAPSLSFCTDYIDRSCCQTDGTIQSNFDSAIISASEECTAMLKNIFCSQCDPWAAHLFGVEQQTPRTVPVMCTDYCGTVYDACKDAIFDPQYSPFPYVETIAQSYRSKESFCGEFGGELEGYCYNGEPYKLPAPEVINTTNKICAAKVDLGVYLDVATTPSQPNNLYLVEKVGIVQLFNMKTKSKTLFLDISSNVANDGEKGLLSMVFHPNFSQNGLFYVFYSCASCPVTCATVADCGYYGSCTDGLCTLKTNPAAPLEHFDLIVEYYIDAYNATAVPQETRQIMKIPQPYANHNGGFMAFSSADGMLYVTIGDGGGASDTEDNGQDLTNILGTIIRIDVTSLPDSGLQYRIPEDNPFYGNTENHREEIWAYGLRNTWRCSFDKARPSYLICADVGQGAREEVDLIVKGGNYGWSKYEASLLHKPDAPEVLNPIFPVMEYDRTLGQSITGGHIYRGVRDACQCGKYVFGDFQSGRFFQGVESPYGSGQYSLDSLEIVCNDTKAGCYLGNIYSFGEDVNNDLYIMGSDGLFQVIDPESCGIETCDCDCVIDGQCYQEGDTNPSRPCEVCSATMPCSWTSMTCQTTTDIDETENPDDNSSANVNSISAVMIFLVCLVSYLL